jgi:hypothetical protein
VADPEGFPVSIETSFSEDNLQLASYSIELLQLNGLATLLIQQTMARFQR